MPDDQHFADALPHGDIRRLFEDVFFVTGTVAMAGRLPMRFSRNMTILRDGAELWLINSVRLSPQGLQALEALGTVKHILRLAGFHGMDDPFYKHRYDATVWSVDAPYVAGFGGDDAPYFTPDRVLETGTALPLDEARFIGIDSARKGEGLLLLERGGGIVVSGDCLQNWHKADRFFSLPARVMMKLMGFIKPHNIGPGWLRMAKPDPAEIKSLLALDFEHVLPAHGDAVIGQAKDKYGAAIARL